MSALKTIVERLKRGDIVTGADRAINELPERRGRKVTNILQLYASTSKKNRERLLTLVGEKEIVPTSTDPRVVNYFRQEKRRRHLVIDKLEELAD